jgi:hypothetical protein
MAASIPALMAGDVMAKGKHLDFYRDEDLAHLDVGNGFLFRGHGKVTVVRDFYYYSHSNRLSLHDRFLSWSTSRLWPAEETRQ